MRLGDATTSFLMDVFVVAIGVKVFGWTAIAIGFGIYVVGTILNGVYEKKIKGKIF